MIARFRRFDISSGGAENSPLAGAATYSATKFGLRAFSLALAQELQPYGVGVSVVSPGPVATGFLLDHLDLVSDVTLSQPMLQPETVAKTIVATSVHRQREVKMPTLSGYLSTIAYAFPFVHRWLQPWLRKKGARAKQRWKRKASHTETSKRH